MDFDVEWARARFPGLGGDLAFFENAGGSVPAAPVIALCAEYLGRDMVQLGAGYARSVRATERVEAWKAAGATLMNAPAEDLVLGASSTANVYVLAHALAGAIGPGDEVVVTEVDHETNRGAWVRMAEARGARVREWALDPETDALELAGLDAVLGERTRLVCFTHCSNVVGTIHDARALVARVHEAGALAVVDGVAFAPHRRVDVAAIGADAYFTSLYKVYGPHLGLMYVPPRMRAKLANQNHAFLAGTGTYELMPGNASHELAAAVPGIVEYLESLDRHHGGAGDVAAAFERIAAQEERLGAPLAKYLSEHPRVRLLGEQGADPARRAPTFAFTADGVHSATVTAATDTCDIAIRHGHFYAHRAMAALGVHDPEDGVVRVSMLHYNTPEEVERLIEVLEGIL